MSDMDNFKIVNVNTGEEAIVTDEFYSCFATKKLLDITIPFYITIFYCKEEGWKRAEPEFEDGEWVYFVDGPGIRRFKVGDIVKFRHHDGVPVQILKGSCFIPEDRLFKIVRFCVKDNCYDGDGIHLISELGAQEIICSVKNLVRTEEKLMQFEISCSKKEEPRVKLGLEKRSDGSVNVCVVDGADDCLILDRLISFLPSGKIRRFTNISLPNRFGFKLDDGGKVVIEN